MKVIKKIIFVLKIIIRVFDCSGSKEGGKK